jgi:hypothetical protein
VRLRPGVPQAKARELLAERHGLRPDQFVLGNGAALAAEGMTNREIAQTLFLSVKTVETHLRGAYRKLDVRSREELPRALEGS